ncbi:MAG TPA: hypothetical protein VGI39_37305 [Polyangiaceae bacterium]
MNKILGVAFVGVIALFLFFRILDHEKKAGAGDTPAAAVTAGGAVAPATMAVASAAAPVPAAPAAPVAALGDDAACARLADLCSTAESPVDASHCSKKLADARKFSGAGNVDKSEACLADAKTCAAASGCISGGLGMGTLGEYLKGLGSALSK